MALTNEQVVDSLLAFYKGRGADLTYLLTDPVFEKLPISDKVEAIKKHAGEINSSSPVGLNREERSQVIGSTIMGGMAGLGAGFTAVNAGMKAIGKPLAATMGTNKALALTLGAGALAGILSAGAVGYLRHSTAAKSRFAVKNQLGLASSNPSDQNAIGVLSIGSQYAREHKLRDVLVDKVSDRMSGVLEGNQDLLSGAFLQRYKANNPNEFSR